MRQQPADKTEIELMAAGLPIGYTKRGICPFCHGGSTHEKTFTVTRSASWLMFNCHRASCSTGGIVTGAHFESGIAEPEPVKDNSYKDEYNTLEQSDWDYFWTRFDLFSIPPFAIGVNSRGQYVMRIFDAQGLPRGYVVRQRPWSGLPDSPRKQDAHSWGEYAGSKYRVYPDDETTILQSIYQPKFSDGVLRRNVVLVEDQISAMKVAQAGATGVALLGVHMDINKVRELQTLQPTKVIFAIDGDATKRSFWLARNFGLAFKSVQVMILTKDLKDIASEDVLPVLGLKQ